MNIISLTRHDVLSHKRIHYDVLLRELCSFGQ
ncbi:hypothetical protein D039_3244A, partial [Vibrio parahaemolyticus EKP-028]